jgi:hypothetical protein
MSEIINVMSSQVEEVNSGIAWLSNDIKDVTELVELLRDAQALSENKSVNTMCCMIVEKLDNIRENGMLDISKSVTKLNKSINDLMIETVNKKATRGTRTTTKTGNSRTRTRKVVKIDDKENKVEKPVNNIEVQSVAE